jgi:hypothetical protein
MFTPDHESARAAEYSRALPAQRRHGLANRTPDGFIGPALQDHRAACPPPAGARSPALWGTRARLDELFGPHASIAAAEQQVHVPLPLAAHCLEVFPDHLRPGAESLRRAWTHDARAALERDLLEPDHPVQPLGDASMVVPSAYLEVVITRR